MVIKVVVILVGDASVGKTNIVSRIVKSNEGMGQKNIAPTIGVQFASKLKKLSDGKIIKCQIWDTGTHFYYIKLDNNNIELSPWRTFHIQSSHYRKALGALVVYDITKYKTFENIKRWISVIKQQADKNIVIILVANKCDLRDQQVVSNHEGQKLAKDQGVFFSETSAVRNQNIQETFNTLVEEINKRRKEQTQVTNESQHGFSLVRKQKQADHCEC